MTKIISHINCGNSPKMQFIKDFNTAFAKGNLEFITQNVSEDISWNLIGHKTINGKESFIEEIEKMITHKASELLIDQILSHGKEGAINGILTLDNGKRYAFSDFYIFTNAKGEKIKSITSYVIELS